MGSQAMDWFKSSYSTTGVTCVEVRFVRGEAHVRDSRGSDGPVLVFDRDEWDAFLRGVLGGEFNMPT
jgi:Domain of unknown function (DUF397)